jgi:hypothetical protein
VKKLGQGNEVRTVLWKEVVVHNPSKSRGRLN